MMALFLVHPYAFWLSLGGILLVAEMLGAAGYLLWSGIAAIITGLVVWLLPLGWEWQGACFAVLTVAAALLWWRWLNQRARAQQAATPLNQRGAQLVGQMLQLDSTLVNGRGHIRVGDSTWPVMADGDLTAGTRVQVIGVDGITLRIAPVQPNNT